MQKFWFFRKKVEITFKKRKCLDSRSKDCGNDRLKNGIYKQTLNKQGYPVTCIIKWPLLYLHIMKESAEINALKEILEGFKKRGKISLAYLYGSYAKGIQHKRSDIDLAIYINSDDKKETIEIIDSVLMAAERPVEILRLDDEDESPFIIQAALRGVPLVEPDTETLYKVAHRALHEAEGIRYKRMIASEQS
jgi:predicted nucleotidyltransferase